MKPTILIRQPDGTFFDAAGNPYVVGGSIEAFISESDDEQDEKVINSALMMRDELNTESQERS